MSLPATYVEGFHDKEAVLQMKYHDLGNTGLKLSHLSFGCGPLGGVYGEFFEEEAIETVREAIRKGVNYFDTAPAYGQGVSETVLGKALAGVPRQAYYISTKVSRYGKEWSNMFDRSEKRIRSEFEKSLQLLGVDYVDILYVHDIEFGSLDDVLKNAIPAVAKLIKEKKACHLGISGYPLSVLKEAVEKSHIPIEVVLSYSRDLIFDNTLQEYIPFFKSKGIGVINAALTGMGILTTEGPPAWHPADPELKELCMKAAKYAEEKGVQLGKLSVSYSLHQPGSDSYLVGIKNRTQLRQNLCVRSFPEGYKKVIQDLKETYFNSDVNLHWEGKEIVQYNKCMESTKK